MKLFDVYSLFDITPIKAKDVYVYDDAGEEYLDLYGGHAVISVGHSHPYFVENIKSQLDKISFYSNSVKNPLQSVLAEKINEHADLGDYQLFLCSSGAESIENALKLASFHTNKKRVIAFKNSFHGRTSAAVAVTDNDKISSPLNKQQNVTFLKLNDYKNLEIELKKGDVCAVIFETIQGVGGLDMPNGDFICYMDKLCMQYQVCLIADEVQSGFSRSGKFFAYQFNDIKPDIITMAKGMGNGFPVGGILINSKIKPSIGLLGTTYGGNHLACIASISVLDILKNQNLQKNASLLESYFKDSINTMNICKVKGKGLMLGLEFDFEVSELRKKLVYEKRIFTGSSSNKNLIRILPPLTISKKHLNIFFDALKDIL